MIVLELADLGGQAGPLVDQLQDLQVELVDLGAEVLQRVSADLAGIACCCAALGFARHGKVSSSEVTAQFLVI